MLDELLTLFDISWRFAWEGQITLNEPLIPMLVLVFVFSLFSLSLSLVRVRTLRDQFVSKCVRLSTLHENRMDSLRLSSLLSGAVWDPASLQRLLFSAWTQYSSSNFRGWCRNEATVRKHLFSKHLHFSVFPHSVSAKAFSKHSYQFNDWHIERNKRIWPSSNHTGYTAR